MSHPFGDLLSQYRVRKHGLTLARLANLAGYDKAMLVRLGQGKKDLTAGGGSTRPHMSANVSPARNLLPRLTQPSCAGREA
jgi:hypothetical protein